MERTLPLNYKELVKNDPINKTWKENFLENIQTNEFYKKNRVSLNLLITKVKNINLKTCIYCVNPGPSLEKNIKILKLIYDKRDSFIICSDVVYYRLIEASIFPDFVCTIDPSETIHRYISGFEDESRHSILFISSLCSNKTYKIWKGPVIIFNQKDDIPERQEILHKIVKKYNFGSLLNLNFVGGTMLQLCSILCPQAVFLVGWDFSADEDLNFYCNGFMDRRIFTTILTKEDVEKDPRFQKEDHKEIYKELIEGDWNKGIVLFKEKLKKEEETRYRKIQVKNLWTNPQLVHYAKVFLKKIVPQSNFKIFNCTEGGILNIPSFSLLESIGLFPTQDIQNYKSLLFPYYV